MKPGTIRIGDAIVIKVNNLTYVVRPGVEGFWIDDTSGLIGVDDDDGNTTWGIPGPDGLQVVQVAETTEDQYQVIEALGLFDRA